MSLAILLDVDRWDRATDAAQDAVVAAVARFAHAFEHVRTERFSGSLHRETRDECYACHGLGGLSPQSGNTDYPDCDTCNNTHDIVRTWDSAVVSHRVATFRHVASGLELILVPGRLEIAPCLVGRAPFTQIAPAGLRDMTMIERHHALVRGGMFDRAFDDGGTWTAHPFGFVDQGPAARIACSLPELDRAQVDAFHELAVEVGPIDPYVPEGCVGRTGSGSASAGGPIGAIAFSPDGRWIATGTTGDVRISDVATGRQLSRITMSRSEEPTAIAFSPDGLRIATLSHLTFDLHEVATGERITSFGNGLPTARMTKLFTYVYRDMRWCADGQILLAEATDQQGKQAYLGLIDPETTETVLSTTWNFEGDLGGVGGHRALLATSFDGSRAALAIPGDPTLVWDVPRLDVVARLAIRPRALALHGDRLYAKIGEQLHAISLDGTSTTVRDRFTAGNLVASPDGARLASVDGSVMVHEMATHETRWVGAKAIMPIAFSPDGTRIATAIVGHGFAVLWPATAPLA